MSPLDVLSRIRSLHWIAASAVILVVDFTTGPFIQFPILFVIPVALATVTHGRLGGMVVGAVLPLIRMSFFLHWELPASLTLELLDTAVDVAILAGFALLIEQIIRQQREIRVLQGMLPICGFCKRIRDESGGWQQMESYITRHSGAQFSHTFCPECGRKHYPGLTE
ncbi:MAG TPA: hypothetical protein VHH32_09980 [Gemmatimonadales bacterium]|nr:hypothetical protein [Gemmatimonadales bacterium]